MWKSIIIISSLLAALGTSTAYAAGLEAGQYKDKLDRTDRNMEFYDRTTFDNMMNSLNINEDMKAGIIFGMEREKIKSYEGPQDNSKGMGIGIGFGFSF
ncbi:hypothetical protein [Maridesulfovibrio sp. FT414]|uniref:hypothetical protein n=1 Tax=Maridesulfovibrio sp. FT414 TaxID=2979469 RepID=UPI003D801BC4